MENNVIRYKISVNNNPVYRLIVAIYEHFYQTPDIGVN